VKNRCISPLRGDFASKPPFSVVFTGLRVTGLQVRGYAFELVKFSNYIVTQKTAPFWLTAALRTAQSAGYSSYSDADFEGFFRPAGATRCTYGGKIWQEGDDQRSPPSRQISFGPLLPAKFYPIGATTRI